MKTSIKGYSIKTKTESGLSGKLYVWVFPKGEIRIEQRLLCEPDYELSESETCIRKTDYYKLVVRFLMLKESSAIHAIKMTADLLNYYNQKRLENNS